ncbi:MAG TPA: HAD-IC family P-type ATPase, partial [Thermoanaerobaculia bacterium]|nr:HAD-IC family P-type ATPase [Thermoanaerobaculia bacterium]
AFARVTPEEKLRIVAALRDAGDVVAVTGDGVNDAPALRRADIGIAMGAIGTDVAKDTADLVLTDDNLGTIVSAIEEGRTIFANITKFVHLMFSHNLGEVIVVFVAVFAGLPLPLLPLQILWMNVVTDIFPAFAIALEPPLQRRMREPPAGAKALLSRPFLFLIAWQAAMLAAIALAAFVWAVGRYGDGAHARTIALGALVAVQLGHTFNCRSRTASAFEGITRNPHLWFAVATVILLQTATFTVAPLMKILGTTSITRADAAVLIACGIVPIVIVELQKRLTRR